MTSRTRRAAEVRPTLAPGQGGAPRRRMRREERRASIIEAAKVAIGRDGPGVSMEAIAREAGVTKPILYRVFGDRDGLVEALAQEFGDELTDGLDAALALVGDVQDPNAGNTIQPREVVVAAVDSYVRLIDQDPNLYRFITDRLADTHPTAEALIERLARKVALTLGDALRAIGGDSGAAEPWAYGLIGMTHTAGDWWVTRRTIPREQLVEYLVALTWDGMAARLGLPDPGPDTGPQPSAPRR